MLPGFEQARQRNRDAAFRAQHAACTTACPRLSPTRCKCFQPIHAAQMVIRGLISGLQPAIAQLHRCTLHTTASRLETSQVGTTLPPGPPWQKNEVRASRWSWPKP